MLIAGYANEYSRYAYIFDQMYRMRAKQFSERRGWRVNVVDGMEIDEFDKHNPLYLCIIDDDSEPIASLRILPTTGPHMLSDVFPEVMGEDGVLNNPDVWEVSRFCVDTDAARKFGSDGINLVTREILKGLFSTALDHDIPFIVGVYDLSMERILRRSGCDFERLGDVVAYDGLKTTAGLFEVTRKVVVTVAGSAPESLEKEVA